MTPVPAPVGPARVAPAGGGCLIQLFREPNLAGDNERFSRDVSSTTGSAVRIFSALLGAFAGNLALVYGARGGIYVTGGVGRQLGPLFDRDAFRRRFTDKGRMSAYLDPIPTRLVKRDETGLLGAAFYPVDR